MQRKQPIIKDGETFWQCPRCLKILPESGFYYSRKTWNNLTSQCRSCHIEGNLRTRSVDNSRKLNRKSLRKRRAEDPEKFRKREREAARMRVKDHKVIARGLLNRAVKKGILVKPDTCSKCSQKKKITAHHHDYNLPLDVEWLCYECHGNK